MMSSLFSFWEVLIQNMFGKFTKMRKAIVELKSLVFPIYYDNSLLFQMKYNLLVINN
jgi:hypothetical protein